jgi:endonuclease/exonuclease/phosphatase family metal-dependent hydrolase
MPRLFSLVLFLIVFASPIIITLLASEISLKNMDVCENEYKVVFRQQNGSIVEFLHSTQTWLPINPILEGKIEPGLDLNLFQNECNTYLQENLIYLVGQWSFPSDHLPVAAQIHFTDHDAIGFASFNVLNENFKHYIYQGQKLTGSDLDKMPQKERELQNVQIVMKALQTLNIHLFALQECSPSFLQRLQTQLDKDSRYRYHVAVSREGVDYGMIIYNQDFLQSTAPPTVIPYTLPGKRSQLNKYIQMIRLKHVVTETSFVFVNTHTEFGQLAQLRRALEDLPSTDENVLVVGDLNAFPGNTRNPPCDLSSQLLDPLASLGYRLVQDPAAPFSHVNTEPHLRPYDHILVKGLSVLPPAVGDDESMGSTRVLRESFSLLNREG